MTEQLKEKIRNLPEEPGIYQMLDHEGNIIYIGKSKCLKKRVKSYFISSPKWEKVKKMVPFICDLDITVTDTHLEAMLLECEMIKSVKPYFNSLMKNDEKYVFLKVEPEGSVRPLSIVYQRGSDCFGPFRSKGRLKEILDALRNLYPLRKNKSGFVFEYHIFPVIMDDLMFAHNRQALIDLLSNENAMGRFIKAFRKKMVLASAADKFETALKYRDLIRNMDYLNIGLRSYRNWIGQSILLILDMRQGHKLFLISKGCVVHKATATEITEGFKEEFIKTGMKISSQLAVNLNDKGSIDFRDIVFAELAELSPRLIQIIPKEKEERRV